MREEGAERSWQIFAEAHASRTGTAPHDEVLSRDRYLVTRAFLELQLLQAGVDATHLRIYGEGVGFRRTLFPGEDPRGRSVYVVVEPYPPTSPPVVWPPPSQPVACTALVFAPDRASSPSEAEAEAGADAAAVAASREMDRDRP